MKANFANRLQGALTISGTSREKLAAHLGVSFSTVRRWLNGTGAPDVYQFREIVHFFGIPYDWFLGDADGVSDAEKFAVRLGLSPDTVEDLISMAKTESPEVLEALDGAVRNVISVVDAVYEDIVRCAEECLTDSLFPAREG